MTTTKHSWRLSKKQQAFLERLEMAAKHKRFISLRVYCDNRDEIQEVWGQVQRIAVNKDGRPYATIDNRRKREVRVELKDGVPKSWQAVPITNIRLMR